VNYSHRCPKGNRQMRRVLNQAANAAVKARGSIFRPRVSPACPAARACPGDRGHHASPVSFDLEDLAPAREDESEGPPSAPRRRKCGRAR
jgi:hypothetical protein